MLWLVRTKKALAPLLSSRRRKAPAVHDVSSRELVDCSYRGGNLRGDLVENGEDLGEVATRIHIPPLTAGVGRHRTEVLDIWRQDKGNRAGFAQPPRHRCRSQLLLQCRFIRDQNEDLHGVGAVAG